MFLKNRVGKQFTVAEQDLKVVAPPPDKPALSDIVLGYKSERTLDGAKAGELRTFQIGTHRIHPAAGNIITLGEEAHVFLQALGVASDYGLRLEVLDGTKVLQEFSGQVGDYLGGPVEHSFALTGMVGGRYAIRARLLDPSGTVVEEASAPLVVSPRSSLPRPWVHRRSFNVSAPGLLPLALGEQLQAIGRYEEAARALEAAVAANNPELVSARWRLAGLYLGWREADRALELLLPLAETHPNQYEVVVGLGFAYLMKGDVANARDYLERARTLRPSGTSLLNALGECYERLGEPAKARQVFQSSLEMDPEQKPIQERLASLPEGS